MPSDIPPNLNLATAMMGSRGGLSRDRRVFHGRKRHYRSFEEATACLADHFCLLRYTSHRRAPLQYALPAIAGADGFTKYVHVLVNTHPFIRRHRPLFVFSK